MSAVAAGQVDPGGDSFQTWVDHLGAPKPPLIGRHEVRKKDAAVLLNDLSRLAAALAPSVGDGEEIGRWLMAL